MLTRIEIDGFKTFHDFELDLEPFQVIVGPNGVGKSNLFDAMQLLSHLTKEDLRTAFQASRGEAEELFSLLPGGQSIDEMSLAVELLTESRVRDEWGRSESLRDTRLRYELVIGREYDREGQEHLRVKRESLKRILVGQDAWLDRHLAAKHRLLSHSRRGTPFISTAVEASGIATVALHQDGRKGRKRLFPAESMERTVLGSVNTTEFPHVFAVREEMRQWRLLQLNPEVLRRPNSVRGPARLSANGDNLARTLARIERENPFVLNDISRDLSNLVPGVLNIEVEEDETKEVYVIYANTQNERRFSSRTLSDGTLRLLTLITLANDPEYRGVLCFEEPENGVHPFRMSQMVGLLRSLSADFTDDTEADWPLRQLLVNTHSPLMMAQLKDTELLFAYMPTRVDPAGDGSSAQVTRIVPVRAELLPDPHERFFTRRQVEKYMRSADWAAAESRLIGADAA
ncbi:MAG: Chromosome partition protein Smc [Anaerolineales bacterium]|nr:Chromosome partition protein Smc [Anaerolineales bacterium]